MSLCRCARVKTRKVKFGDGVVGFRSSGRICEMILVWASERPEIVLREEDVRWIFLLPARKIYSNARRGEVGKFFFRFVVR